MQIGDLRWRTVSALEIGIEEVKRLHRLQTSVNVGRGAQEYLLGTLPRRLENMVSRDGGDLCSPTYSDACHNLSKVRRAKPLEH